MRKRLRVVLSVASAVLLSALLQSSELAAQPAHVPQKQLLQQLIRLEQKVPEKERGFFSSALSNSLALAHAILDQPTAGPDDDGSKPLRALAGARSGKGPAPSPTPALAQDFGGDDDSDTVQVSNPGFDLQFSRLTGFTQSTSASAWCGNNVVTGFNSTTASVTTGVVPFLSNSNLFSSSISNVGVAFSTNDGRSFTDLGFLNPGPTSNTTTSMLGNPVVVCASPQRFYYLTSPFSILVNDPATFSFQLFSGVGLSVSSDGGQHWADPVAPIIKDLFNLLDQGWIAVDPTDHNRLYIVYVDLDLDGILQSTAAAAKCPNTIRHALEVITSADGGHTWSAPSVVRQDCDPLDAQGLPHPGFVQGGPQLAVAPNGEVLISYVVFAPNGSVQLKFRRSRNQGRSYDAEVRLGDVVPTGDPGGAFGAVLQGLFANPQLPTMAVDPVQHNGHYTIYVAWSDGRDHPQADVVASAGVYNFSDILVVSSRDGGASWSAPRPVSATPNDFAGAGRDQFQPGVAVEPDGSVAVCYYDRRNDPLNNAIDHYCSISRDGGHVFHDIRQTRTSWIPAHSTDFFLNDLYLGQYDTVAPHQAAKHEREFFSGFQIITRVIPSVHGRSVRSEE